MKRATTLVALVLATTTVFARAKDTHPHTPNTSVIFTDSTSNLSADLQESLDLILEVLGLTQSFTLKEADVRNMEASINKRKRYIRYNPRYVNWLNSVTHSNWATITLLAHEIGHHLNGHTLKLGGSKPAVELEADEFAGFVMRKLGASLEEAQEVMKYVATVETSDTHPCRKDRMAAIKRGWEREER